MSLYRTNTSPRININGLVKPYKYTPARQQYILFDINVFAYGEQYLLDDQYLRSLLLRSKICIDRPIRHAISITVYIDHANPRSSGPI